MTPANSNPLPPPEEEKPYESQLEVQQLMRLIQQARSYLPGDLCGELVLALFAYADAECELYKRDLTEAEFGGRGPEKSLCR